MATKEVTQVQIPEIKFSQMVVKIKGKTPLLMNKWTETSIDELEKKQTKEATNKKGAREPKKEFKEHQHYIQNNGKVINGFPSAGIKKALVSAGGRFADEKMTKLRGAFSIPCELVEIKGSKPVMQTDAVNIRGIGSLAYRPRFDNWTLEVPVIFNESIISAGQILNLFQLAGFSVGLGSWRPECKGSYGQYEVLYDETEMI